MQIKFGVIKAVLDAVHDSQVLYLTPKKTQEDLKPQRTRIITHYYFALVCAGDLT